MSTQVTSATATICGAVLTDGEVRALIAVWGETNVQEQLDGAIWNKAVFQDTSKKLQATGYNRDRTQCRTKVKSLKKQYRVVKDHNGETGKGRKTCKFYEELDNIIGQRPASVSTALLDTGASSSAAVDSQGIAEETEETDTNGKLMRLATTYTGSSADGEDVQAQSPVDGALVPASSDESTSSKRPGDETGAC